MKLLRWLAPGLGIKRWFLLFTVGLLAFATGWAIALQRSLLSALDEIVRQTVLLLTGRFLPASVGGFILVGLGAAVVIASVQGAFRSVTSALMPAGEESPGDIIVQRRWADRGPRVVAIGGGTGLATLVRGLKEYTSRITAVVTVTDDGGSSGRLVGELGILPPGDIRNVLAALADKEPLMAELLQHRFSRGSLEGHPFGNLLIAALTEVLGDFEQAVRHSSKVLAVRGQVLPSTLTAVHLGAELVDGSIVHGETNIVNANAPIKRVFLVPQQARPLPAVLTAIAEADLIVLGPGSLFTSILPNLLIKPLADAVRHSSAVKVFVVNVMTQPGETDGYSAQDHVTALLDHAGVGICNVVLTNSGMIEHRILQAYQDQGAVPVRAEPRTGTTAGLKTVRADVVARGDLVRHDPEKLAGVLMRLLLEHRSRPLLRPSQLLDDLWLGERLWRSERRLSGSRGRHRV